ncbi:MAG: cytochrome c oxidase accessory protein CcoG [Alphaproteobacteria bacterium]|nr:MAG: cytochrome c oxidase accessory protein CcoG [Alphaproteobacteria bacterium]
MNNGSAGKAATQASAVSAPGTKHPLYKSREPIYPKLAHGTYRRIKWAIMVVTLGIYYLLPWLRFDRGPNAPDQAVLLDLPGRRFYFFWIEIWPQEVYYLTGLLILGALALFLATSLFGRVWCGYTCPQTVWTDLFIHVERWIQGDRNRRIRLDRQPWNFEKIWKKGLTHLVWLLIAVATGGAWVFYFADAPTLMHELLVGTAPAPAYIAIGAFTFTTYSLGGLMREQVCIYMCPWPRIQGAMFDEYTLLVSYDEQRGEPRGPHKKGEPWEGRGDCVDCRQCVAVCPMGIDIRDGPQLECIQCALCIDACDEIMDRVGRPRRLIRYATLATPSGKRLEFKPIRPRTVIYATLIVLIGGLMLYSLLTRSDLEASVLHDRNPLYVRLSDGGVRNGYQLKVLNKSHDARDLKLSIEGLPAVSILRPLHEGPADRIRVDPDDVAAVRLYLKVPKAVLRDSAFDDGEAEVTFRLTDPASGSQAEAHSVFRVPTRRR